MSDPYYRWFPGDYIRDTGTLTLLEHGAYQMLLNYYYVMEGIPSKKSQIYSLLRSKKRSEQRAINFILEKYFVLNVENGERYINKRADTEISERKAFIEKQRLNGRLGGKPKHLPKPIPTANPSPNPNLNLPSPLPLLSKKDQDLKPLARTRGKASGPVRGVTWDQTFSGITEPMIAGWGLAYPAIDIHQQLCAMDEWLISHPEKRKKNYYRFITGWLGRHQEKGR